MVYVYTCSRSIRYSTTLAYNYVICLTAVLCIENAIYSSEIYSVEFKNDDNIIKFAALHLFFKHLLQKSVVPRMAS